MTAIHVEPSMVGAPDLPAVDSTYTNHVIGYPNKLPTEEGYHTANPRIWGQVMTWFDDVVAFYEKMGIKPEHIKDPKYMKEFRLQFKREELGEYEEALEKGDVVGQVDACIDLIYVTLGTMYLSGFFHANEHWNAVHRANMAKERGIKPGRENSGGFDAIKPPGWQGPEARHAALLAISPVNPVVLKQAE